MPDKKICTNCKKNVVAVEHYEILYEYLWGEKIFMIICSVCEPNFISWLNSKSDVNIIKKTRFNKMIYCPLCEGISFYKDGDYVVCTNCGHRCYYKDGEQIK